MSQDTSQTGQTGGTAASTQDDYNIPAVVMQKYPDLVALIKKTESMLKEERDYWFQILPIMTEEQVSRLRKILDEEAAQLAKLDDEYQAELKKLNKKHLEEWDTFERQKGRKELEAKEKAAEAEEAATEEELLKKLEEEGE